MASFQDRITLEGVQEIIRQFGEMANAGQRAFKQLETAASGARIDALVPQVNRLSGSLTGLLGSASALKAGLAGLFTVLGGRALFDMVADAARAADAIQDLADITGASTDEIQRLVFGLATFGVSTETAMTSIQRLAISIENIWPKVRKEIEDSADAQQKLKLSAKQSSNAVVAANQAILTSKLALKKATEDLAQLDERQARQSAASTLSVKNAKLALRDAQLRLRELQGEDVSAERRALEIEQAQLAVREAQQRVAEETRKKAQEGQQQQIERIEAQNRAVLLRQQYENNILQAQVLQLQKQEALDKIEDERKNKVQNIAAALQRAAQGDAGALDKINRTPENLAKGVVAAAAGLENFNGDLATLRQTAPQGAAVLEKLKEAFKVLTPQERIAVGRELAGRGFNKDFVDFLTPTPEQAKRVEDAINKIGVSPEKIKGLDDLNKKLNGLSATIDILKQQSAASVSGAIEELLDKLTGGLQGRGLEDGSVKDKFDKAVAEAEQGLQNLRNLDFSQSGASQLFETLPDDVKAKWDRAREATQNGIDSIRNLDYSNTAAGALFRSLPEEIQTAIAGLADILISPFSKWFNTVMEFIRLVARALASIRPAAPNSSVSGTPTGSGEPFARGGQVFGPGTGTSDSILARLSRGEFVIRAAAVDHFGANFFAALNAMRMPKFSAGGIADSLAASLAIPRFASGGMVSGGGLAPVTINFPGAGSFNVHASGDTVSNLRRAATRARVSSGGRKPSGYA